MPVRTEIMNPSAPGDAEESPGPDRGRQAKGYDLLALEDVVSNQDQLRAGLGD